MADDINTPSNSDQPAGSANAQQALDDLTVLHNIENQSLGDARLNIARPTDVSDTSLGNLANVQQGSTGAPQVQSLGAVTSGVNIALDVAIESTRNGTVAPPELGTSPAPIDESLANVSVTATGATPLNVQELPNLAQPDETFKPQEPALGQPVGAAAPTGSVSGYGVQAAAAAPTAAGTSSITLDQTQAVNHDPTLTVDGTNSGHGIISGTIGFSDPDGDGVSISLVGADRGVLTVTDANGNPAGTVTLSADGHSYTFTPLDNWQGGEKVSFQIEASDGRGGTAFQTINLTEVDTAPTLDASGKSGHGSITGAITTGDSDGDAVTTSLVGADNGVLTVTDANGHAAGTVTLSADGGSYTFTPNADWQGGEKVSFDVQASDGHGGVTTQTINLTETNAGPSLDAPTSIAETENHGVYGQLSATDTDTGDTASFHLTGSEAHPVQTMVVDGHTIEVVQTDHGTVALDTATGSYEFKGNDGTQHLGVNESVPDSFTVTVSDGHGGTDSREVGITITGSNDGPTVTSHDNLITADDHTAIGGRITATDGDTGTVDGVSFGAADTVSFSLVDAHGNHVTSLTTDHGTVEINPATGEYTFTPNDGAASLGQGQSVPDSFSVVAIDNHGQSSNPAVVSVTVTGSDDGPVVTAHHDATATDHGGLTTGGVTGGDIDAGDHLTYSFGTDAGGHAITSLTTDHGSVEINPATGEFTFTPNDGAASLGQGETARDGFTVTVTDSFGKSTTQDVGVNISGTDDGPVIDVNQTTSSEAVSYGNTVGGQIHATDADTNDVLSYSLESGGTHHGTLDLNPDTGAFTYTPGDNGFTGTDTFTVSVSDGHGGTTTQNVTFDVTGAPPPNGGNGGDTGGTDSGDNNHTGSGNSGGGNGGGNNDGHGDNGNSHASSGNSGGGFGDYSITGDNQHVHVYSGGSDESANHSDHGDVGGSGHDIDHSPSADSQFSSDHGGHSSDGGFFAGEDGGGDTFLFDFGHGHATVGGDGNWTDTADQANGQHGANVGGDGGDGHNWTAVADNAHDTHSGNQNQQNNGHKDEVVVDHSNQADSTSHFQNIEHHGG